MAASPQTLTLADRRVVAAWAADCAEHVLALYEAAAPGDARVRASIDQARLFSAGDLDVGDATRRRGGDAGAAARDAPTPAAKAAAYAAEQAAAVAHMGAHALGAAGYAAKACALDVDCEDDAVARSEAQRQVAEMTEAVVRAISSLPPSARTTAALSAPAVSASATSASASERSNASCPAARDLTDRTGRSLTTTTIRAVERADIEPIQRLAVDNHSVDGEDAR